MPFAVAVGPVHMTTLTYDPNPEVLLGHFSNPRFLATQRVAINQREHLPRINQLGRYQVPSEQFDRVAIPHFANNQEEVGQFVIKQKNTNWSI
jgi:hypothetical protein